MSKTGNIDKNFQIGLIISALKYRKAIGIPSIY